MFGVRKAVWGLTILCVIGLAAPAGADMGEKPIQVALFNPIQIFDEDTSVKGLRLNILYGVNRDMTGIDLGLANHNRGVFQGFQYGLIGITEGDFTGWQDNAFNYTEGRFKGVQTGFYNGAGSARGFLWGAVNITDSMEGLQLGIFNMTDRLDGLQIGIINVVKEKESLPILPIVNWSFD